MLLRELTQIEYQTVIDGHSVVMILSETTEIGGKVANIKFGTSASTLGKSLTGHVEHFLKNPLVVGLALSWAQNKLEDYNRSKKYSIKFFAQTGQEKTFYRKMVDDLLASGNYKLIKSTYVNGGYNWTLNRKHSY